MSSIEPASDKISVGTEVMPQAGSVEGTKSSLNEAPRSEFDDGWSVPDFAKHWPQQDIDVLKEMAWQSYQCGYFESLRDGQPG